jgi:phospholipid/cholesterol/gamma-HCH transport system substrate-binding protein
MKVKVIRLASFVIVTVLLTAWIGQNITGGSHGSRYELTATFNDVAGMYDGDDVKLAGLTVGQVTGIDVVEGRALVRFEVDDTVQLPEDSTVAVRWRNLIGQRFLGLEPGTGTTMLGDGDTMDNAKNVVDLGQLVNQLVPLARAVSPDQVNTILTTLLQAFDGNDATFDELLSDFDSVLGTLAARDDTIGQLVEDYDTITTAVASRDAQIGQMVDNLVAISETFAANDDLLDQALVELASLSTGADHILDEGARDLGLTLDHLAVLTGTAADHVDELESALVGLPPLFQSLLTVLDRGEWLRVSVLCLTVSPGPCPLPVSVSGGPGEDPIVVDPGSVLEDLLGPFGGGG